MAGGGNEGGLVGYHGAWAVTAGCLDRQARSPAGLQEPTGYTGTYADWNVDIDAVGSAYDPWEFGTSSEYPTLW